MNDSFPPLRPSGGRWSRLLIAAVLALGAILFLEITFGQVTGSEFSPDRFERRSFVYYQIPWFRVQISPVVRDDVSNELETYLRRKKLISAPPVGQRWEVVSVAFAADRRPASGPAHVLCRYLDQEDAERNLWWLKWSREHPELAKPLWDAVQQTAQLDAYVLVPELFDLALRTNDAEEFSRQVNQWLTQQYADLAADYRASGRPAEAKKYDVASETRAGSGSPSMSAEVPEPTAAFP